MLKNFAELKRSLEVGTELYCIKNHAGPCRLYRKVEKVQTNAIAYSGDGIASGKRGWTYFPKTAKDVEMTPLGFRFYFGEGQHRTYIEYEFK